LPVSSSSKNSPRNQFVKLEYNLAARLSKKGLSAQAKAQPPGSFKYFPAPTDDPAFTIENEPEQTCLGALIRVSDEFGGEEDLKWVCKELDQQGPGDPFRIIGAEFKSGVEGKRLTFLQDARVARIRHLSQANNT
jgi:hypothetical protein